jgi:D-arabinose 1-dehydrogenase-like Zn-dependent alcohol dehydrogenase
MSEERTFRRQSLIAYGQPLRETTADRPTPRGSEVLVRVACCGVCHSDLHVQDGYFALGGDRRLDITKDRALPFTLGHEIAGVIEAAGESAEGADIGREVAVYPWIGCGQCAACRAGEENMCSAHHHLGVAVDGGFANYVMVPHPRYLIDHAPLPASFAGPLMCSGLTAYSALKRLGSHAERGPVLLVGLGGVGMMGLALARTLFRQPLFVADIDAEKRNAALATGAAQAFDPADPQVRKAIMAATGGGLFAVCDFVGSDKSLQFATSVLARGGKVVVTGLLGGSFSIPAAMIAIKAISIEGTLTGALAQARELIALARSGKIAPIPTQARPLKDAQGALDDLRAGHVIGRTVLTN